MRSSYCDLMEFLWTLPRLVAPDHPDHIDLAFTKDEEYTRARPDLKLADIVSLD